MRKIIVSLAVLATSGLSTTLLAENIPCPSPQMFSSLGDQIVSHDGLDYGPDKGWWGKSMPIKLADNRYWSINVGPIQYEVKSGEDFDEAFIVGKARKNLSSVLPARPSTATYDGGLASYVCNYPTTGGRYRVELFMYDKSDLD